MIEKILKQFEQEFLLLNFKELSSNENYPEVLFNLLFFLSCVSESEYKDCIKNQFSDTILKEIFLNKSRFRLSFYNGMAGIIFLLENSEFDSKYSDLLIRDFSKMINDNMLVLLPFFKKEKKEYEFFGGMLGIIYYYFQRKVQKNFKEIYIIEKSLNKLLGFIRDEVNSENFDISLVHGTISFLKIFYNCSERNMESDELYRNMFDIYLKLLIDKEKLENIFGGRMGWCKSRASTLLLLQLVSVENKETSCYFYNELMSIFESSSSDWKFEDSYLCHGYAGMSVMMSTLNYKGDNRVFVREKLFEELYRSKDLIGDIIESPNVIENRLGVILALINDYSQRIYILNKFMLMM